MIGVPVFDMSDIKCIFCVPCNIIDNGIINTISQQDISKKFITFYFILPDLKRIHINAIHQFGHIIFNCRFELFLIIPAIAGAKKQNNCYQIYSCYTYFLHTHDKIRGQRYV